MKLFLVRHVVFSVSLLLALQACDSASTPRTDPRTNSTPSVLNPVEVAPDLPNQPIIPFDEQVSFIYDGDHPIQRVDDTTV